MMMAASFVMKAVDNLVQVESYSRDATVDF
jgi:hypothetical protein